MNPLVWLPLWFGVCLGHTVVMVFTMNWLFAYTAGAEHNRRFTHVPLEQKGAERCLRQNRRGAVAGHDRDVSGVDRPDDHDDWHV